MLPEFGPESGALATVGEFVLRVTMTWGGGGGGGGQSIRIQITCDFPGGGFGPPSLLDPRMKTHSSDVLLMV